MSKFGRTEKFILIAASIVFAIMAYFLYDDSLLFPKTSNMNFKKIGTVSSSEHDVRRKNFDAFSWLPTSTKDPIYVNDSIFTGDRSEAVISLSNGATIRLQSNSLVTLNEKSGQMQLDLRYGNFKGQLTGDASMTIKANNTEFTLKNTAKVQNASSQLEIKKDYNGSVAVKVISGSASLTNKKRQGVTDLSQGQGVKVLPSKSSMPEKEKEKEKESTTDLVDFFQPLFEINLQTKDNLIIIREDPTEPIVFEWTTLGDMQNYEFETSLDGHFENIVIAERIELKKMELIKPLNTGTYYWRVKGFSSHNQVMAISPVHKFNISEPEKILAPEVPDKITPPATPEVTNIPEPLLPPSQPQILKKHILFLARTFFQNDGKSQHGPVVEWNPILNIKNFVVQVSKDKQFKNSERIETKDSKALWNNYQPGNYYYRVFARGTNNLLSKPSETGIIEVSVEKIKITPIKALKVIGNEPTDEVAPVTWTKTPFAQSYLLQLSKDSNFTNSKQLEVTTNEAQIPVSEVGNYHIRVQPLDKNRKPLAEFSPVETFSYNLTLPLPPPKLLEPMDKVTIFLQNEADIFIWLEWKKVKGSSSYTLEVSDQEDFSNIIIEKTLSESRYLIKGKIPLERAFWRVRSNAEDDSKASDWSEKREFTFIKNKNELFGK